LHNFLHIDYSKKIFGMVPISELVEQVAGVLGTLLITIFTPILPYALSFAVGAQDFRGH